MASFIVVGSGVAGLSCAWKLLQSKHEVVVLERANVPGGRMRTERRGSYLIELGAQYVASAFENVHAIAERIGIAGQIRPIRPALNAVLKKDHFEAGDYSSPLDFVRSQLVSTGSKFRLTRIILDIARNWRRLDPRRPELAAPLDNEDLPTYVRRLVDEEAFEYLFGPAFSVTYDSDPEDLSSAFLLLTLRFLQQGFRLQSFVAGNGTFPEALAKHVHVRFGCEVTAIETDRRAVRVHYSESGRQRVAAADAAAVAIPGSMVRYICPQLTVEEQEFFSHVRYVAGIIVHLMFHRAPTTLPYYGVAFPRSAGLDLYGLAVDHQKEGVAPPAGGLINAALTATAAARLWDAPDERIVKLVLENLARTPIGTLEPHDYVVHRWAPMLPQFRPGYLRQLDRFHRRHGRSPSLVFAGDYLINPSLEGAVTSGIRAAEELMAFVRR